MTDVGLDPGVARQKRFVFFRVGEIEPALAPSGTCGRQKA